MKIIQKNTLKALALCAGFFSLVACKENSVIKPDLNPEIDNVNTFGLTASDFDIELTTSYFDSLRTDNATTPIMALGSITSDPFFGATDAGIYFQFAPNVDGFSWPDALERMDSAVLVIPGTGVTYGDSALTNYQSVKVYRITQDDFKLDENARAYYAFDSVSVDKTTPLGSRRFSNQNLKYDSLAYPSGDTIGGQLRIRLSDAFATEIKDAGDDVYANFSTFISRFKGLYIAPDPDAVAADKNMLSYLYMGVSSSDNYRKARVEFWYHNTGDTAQKVSFFTFNPISSAFFGSIRRNHTGTPSAGYVGSPALRDSLIIQGAPGLRTEITIKNLQNIPESVILKAALTITVLKVGSDDLLTPPLQLIPSGVDSNGNGYTIADLIDLTGTQTTAAEAFVGGSPKTVVIGGISYIQYTINMPRELQAAKTAGKTELKIRLSSSVSLPGAYRLVAPGPGIPSDLGMKFDVIYSKM